MAGLDRSAKIYNSVYGIDVNDKEMMAESARLYREQITKTNAYKDASEQMKRFILGSFTGSVVENGDPNLISVIPAIDTNKLSKVMDSGDMFVASRERTADFVDKRKRSLFGKYAFQVDKLSSLNDKQFFLGMIKNVESAQFNGGLTIEYENVTKGYNIAQTSRSAKAAIDNALNHGFVSWDLETMAGNRYYGPTRYPGAITEFSFRSYDKFGKEEAGKSFNAIIGATDDELAKYKDILRRLENGTGIHRGKLIGNYFTDEEAVTIERLALAGNSASVLDESRASQGILSFKSFASKRDISAAGYSVKDIRRGIEIYERAAKIQGNASVAFGVNGKSFQVKAWENELLSGLREIQSGKTALGFNSRQFDIGRLRHLVASEKVSGGFRNAITEMFGDTFDFKHHLDALAVIRSRLDPNDLYTSAQHKALKGLELTSFTQEALTRLVTSVSGDLTESEYERLQQGAHLGDLDTKMLATLTTQGGLFGDQMIDTSNNYKRIFKGIYDGTENEATSKILGKDDLIFAKNYVNPERYNLLMTFRDKDTGALITHANEAIDNIVIDPRTGGKVYEDKFNRQMGMQRGTFYKVDAIAKVDVTKEQFKDLEQAFPHLANNDLYTIKLSQYYNPKGTEDFEKTARSRGEVYYTGTLDDIQRMINNNTLSGGHLNQDGTIDYSDIKEDTLRQYNPVIQSIDSNGVGNFEYKYKDNLLGNREAIMEDAMSMADVKVQEDAAARMNRSYSFGKDTKLLELMHKMNDEIDSQLGGQIISDDERTLRIKNLEKEFFNNSVEINKRMLAGEDINVIKKTMVNGGNIWDRSFHSTLGFEFINISGETTKAGLYSSTLSSQIARMSTIKKNQAYIESALEMSKDWAGADSGDKANFIYKQIRKVTADYLRSKGNYAALGYDPSGMQHAYAYENRFEINLNGFKGIKGDTNFTVYLDNTNTDMVADRLADKVGPKLYKSPESKVALMKDLQEFLMKKGKIRSFDHTLTNDIDLENRLTIDIDDSSLTAGNKLVKHMISTRGINPSLGHRNGTGIFGLDYELSKEFGTVDEFKAFAKKNILDKYDPSKITSFGMPGQNRDVAKLTATRLANTLFDSISYDDLVNKYGYSSNDANNLIKINKVKKSDAISYMTEIFNTVGDTGGDLLIEKNGKVSAIFGDTAYDLQLASSKFEQGQFVDRIGSRKVSLGYGIYKTADSEGKPIFKEMSVLKAREGKLKGLLKWAENRVNIDGEDPSGVIKSAISSFFMDVSEDSPAIKHVGLNSRTDQFRYIWDDVMHNLHMVSDELLSGNYDKYIRDSKGVFKELLRNIDPKTGKIISSNGKRLIDFSMDEANIVAANWDPIFRVLQDKFLHKDDNISKSFFAGSKKITKGIGSTQEEGLNLFTSFSGQAISKRGPERFLDARIHARADAIAEILKLANEDDPQEILKLSTETGLRQKDVAHLKGIKINGAMMTSGMAASLGDNPNAFREIRMTTLNTNMDILNRKMVAALDDILTGKSTKYTVDQLRGRYSKADIDIATQMFLEEGQAYIDGQVFDRFFNDSESVQKIEFNYNKMAEMEDGFIIDAQHRASNLPFFDVDNLKFKYMGGTYVNEGENIIHYSSQSGAMPRKAKYSGILKFGFFDINSNLVGEDKITELISGDDELLTSLKDTNTSRFDKTRSLFQKIQDAGLTGYFYVQSESANPYNKLSVYKEKNMNIGLIESTGAVNKDISDVLVKLGFKNVGTGHGGLTDNTLLNIDLIDSIKDFTDDEEASGDFWTVASHRYSKIHKGKEKLTKEKFMSILKESNFRSAEAFRHAIMDERGRTSELVQILLHEAGLAKDGQIIQQIANNADAIKKHKDLVSLEAQVNNLLEKNIKDEAKGAKINDQIVNRALAKTAEQFHKYVTPTEGATWQEIFDIDEKRGSIILKKKLGELKAIGDKELAELGLSNDGHLIYENGRQTAEVVTSVVRQLDYYQNQKFGRDSVKANQRTITNLEQMRYSRKGMEDAKLLLEKGGHSDLFEKYIAGNVDGQTVNDAAIDQIKKRLFDKGEVKIAGYMKDANGDFVWGVDESALEKFVDKYNVYNGEKTKGVKLLKGLIEQTSAEMGSKVFKDEGVLNMYRVWSSAIAASYNMGDISEAGIEEAGFQKINIKDLIFDKDGRIANSVGGKNLLIDLHDEDYGLGDTLRQFIKNNENGERRYLAVSYTPRDVYLNKEEYLGQTHIVLKELQRKMQDYHDSLGTVGGKKTYDELGRQKQIEDLGQIVKNLSAAQYNQFMAKGGVSDDLTRAFLADGMYNAASGIDINHFSKEMNYSDLIAEAAKNNVSLKDLNIGGVNLMEEAAKGEKGLQLNYTILSKDRMMEIYNRRFTEFENAFRNEKMSEEDIKTFSDLFKSDVEQRVQTEGVSGISYRQPTIYHGSVTQRQLFFNDIVKGNQAINNFAGAAMRKEDYDSDKVLNAIHKEAARIEYKGKSIEMEIDSAMYNSLKNNKDVAVTLLDEGAEERFHKYIASNIYIGANQAQRYRRLVEDTDAAYGFDSYSMEHLKENGNLIHDKFQNIHVKHEEARDLYDSYLTQLEAAAEDEKAMDIGEKRVRALKALDEQASKLMKNEKEYYKNVSEITADVKDDAAKALFDKYKALKFGMKLDLVDADIVASSAQSMGAGMANSYTQTISNITQRALSTEEGAKLANEFFEMRGYKGMTAGTFSEQMTLISLALQEGALSPKNEDSAIGYFSEDKIKQLKEGFEGLIKLGERPNSDKEAVREKLANLIYDNLSARADKEILKRESAPSPLEALMNGVKSKDLKKYYKSLNTEGYNPDTKEGMMTAVRQMSDMTADFLVNALDIHADMRKASQAPGSRHRVGEVIENHLSAMMGGKNNLQGVFLRVLNNMGREMGVTEKDGNIIREIAEVGIKNKEAILHEADEAAAEAARTSETAVMRNLSRVVSKNASNLLADAGKGLGGNTILGAAIGLAGGLLISGFANDPKAPPPQPSVPPQQGVSVPTAAPPASSAPQPNEMMAAGADAQMPTAQPISLADSNLNVMRGSKKKSYVINISGDTNRSRNQAMDALNKAMYDSGSQNDGNGNISMAVNNNYRSSLTQAQVNRMVQQAMIA